MPPGTERSVAVNVAGCPYTVVLVEEVTVEEVTVGATEAFVTPIAPVAELPTNVAWLAYVAARAWVPAGREATGNRATAV